MDKRKLLKDVLQGKASLATLEGKGWLFVCRTYLNGSLVKEDIFAKANCSSIFERDRITPSKAQDIAKEVKAGNLFGLTFLAEREFDTHHEVTTWSAFGSFNPVAGMERPRTIPDTIEPTELDTSFIDEEDFYIGNINK